jgi:hypothetical protein
MPAIQINLELFFINEELTGNSTFRKMAITHADQTLLNHIRPDGEKRQLLHPMPWT